MQRPALTTGGTLLSTAEVFDPLANAFAPFAGLTLPEGRADHTATLLPSGDVLVAGGRIASGPTASGQLISVSPLRLRTLAPLQSPRASHTATLLPTGRILVAGGETPPALATAEQFVPTAPDTVAPSVAQVLPAAGATGVDPGTRVAVRLSEPIDPRSLTATSFTLSGPGGAVTGTLSAGEGGLLAFFTPTAPLSFGAPYTVTLSAAILDTAGNALAPFSSPFTVHLGGTLAVSLAPPTLNVGQSSSLTVQLPVPAPPGGVTVGLTSGNSAVATLGAPSVTIPAGQQTAAPVTVAAVGPGIAALTATAPGFTDGSASLTVTLLPPTVTSFTPTSGRVGDSVTINGTNFLTVSSVAFNNVPVPLPVPGFIVVNSTTIQTSVPAGATTGPIAVTTASGIATSAGSFVVLPTQDFQLTALPATVTVPSAGQGAFTIGMAGAGGFTGLTTLAVSGVPTGTTAAFAAPTLTAGQNTVLTLQTGGTTPAGSYPLTVTASGLLNGVQTTRQASLALQVQAAGQTSLTGQVLDEDAKPVKGAVIRLGTLQTTTDDAGNFLISNPPVGANQLLIIDGGPASPPGKNLPIIPYKVTVVAGQTNTLGFTPYLHFQKTTGLVDISNSSVQRVVTQPEIPGYQMTIPTGVTITGWDGQPNTQISVRKVAIDRSPTPPMPAGVVARSSYMDYFGKPGGGTPSAPVPITFPNDLDVPPGTQVQLWFYDEAPDGSRPNAWAQYGTGTVSADGSQIVPDTDPTTGRPFGQPRFCCGEARAAQFEVDRQALQAQRAGERTSGTSGGDPVDLASGIFTLSKTDLVLPGRLPLVFTRTYRTLGPGAGPFGPGTAHTYHVLLLVEGNLRTLVLPTGQRLAFPQQPDGTFQNVTDPAGRGAVLRQQLPGHVLRFKDGTTWTFGQPTPGTTVAFLSAQADRTGNTVTFTRTGNRQDLVAITEPAGRQLALTYDASGQITTLTDPIGRTVTYTYGPGGLATVTDPAGGVTRYTYDAQNRITSITDPRGITFLTNEYDANGRVVRQTQADGGVWQFAYTVTAGTVPQTVVTDPRGNPTTSRFNGQGYLLGVTDALGQTTTYTRDSATNQLLAATDPLGRVTRFAYDANGNVTTVTDPAGSVRTLTYEPAFNKVTSISDPLGNVTRFAYDPTNGNLLTITDPLGGVTQIAYNASGQPVSTTDALGKVTQFTYNSQGDLATVADPLGNTTTREYDAMSRLIRQLDPRGKPTGFAYDSLNRILSVVDALGGTTALTYDPNANLLTVTDARGNTSTHEYDPLDRLAKRIDPLGAAETFAYDRAGNLETSTDRKGQTTTFTYDALNRRVQAAFADGATATFTYDPGGRLIQADDTADPHRPIAMAYDGLDRLLAETTAVGVVSYQYDPLGRRTQMVVSGQSPVAYTYDAASRLRTITQAPLTPVDIQYDPLGRRTLLTLPNGVSTAYQYDEVSRLTALIYRNALGPLGDLIYQYDAAGNSVGLGGSFARTLLPDSVPSGTYDAANRQLQFGDAMMGFDPNGDLVSVSEAAGTTLLAWDARRQLASMSRPGLPASFAYDTLGRRAQRVVSGQATAFQYDGLDIAGEIAGIGTATYLRTFGIDEVLARIASDGVTYYLRDALGSSLLLTDANGTGTTSYTYAPFGQTSSAGPDPPNSLQYTGRENDGTGLYFYRARYYHPSLSRFLSQDPLGLQGGLNPYAYVGNNPTRSTDPFGLKLKVKNDPDGSLGRALEFLRINTNSPTAASWIKELDDSPLTYTIDQAHPGSGIAVTNVNILAHYIPFARLFAYGGRIFIDPTVTYITCTEKGPKPTSLEVVLAHELGHLATWKRDNDAGPPKFDNVRANENPVRRELGRPLRASYGFGACPNAPP